MVQSYSNRKLIRRLSLQKTSFAHDVVCSWITATAELNVKMSLLAIAQASELVLGGLSPSLSWLAAHVLSIPSFKD